MAIGIAFIGAGLFVKDYHLPGVQASPDLELKAVYSRSLKSAASIAPDRQLDRYADDAPESLEQLLARDDIQAVIIALPITNQAAYVRAALSAGKHVLSEKPIAKDLAEATALLDWYRSTILPQGSAAPTWSVAENFRYFDTLRQGRAQLARLGRIRQFRTQVYFDCRPGKFVFWPFFALAWRQQPEHQGGAVLDIGVHHVAAMRYLLGGRPGDRITQVSAFVGSFADALPPVDTVDAVLRTESGAQGTFQLSGCSSLDESGWTVVGEKGHVRVTDDGVVVHVEGEDDEMQTLPVEILAVGNEIRAWGEALTSGKLKAEQRPEEALADLEVIELILKSGKENGAPQVTRYQC
ncbi:oxidoreductase family, NAD-binding Rossmann fold protein [Aspergillus uvarum CBS 121591]|uniref:Oxidoreductase family, NAD-binding Rossmann fold protein n=1 Tax=Aspergillus uvarum CBS 121591 TaxID=1448315 RepID=A0A319BTF3_9EURO|nr:oxidoreductase family, NAD-binding Rossmann fold protein [Aspergillus uvarum CBS 121591]PYH76916.1 oxidoreductase family, NAD-binding Rossmann fold protein [Aspergillus uvarum CBS 121591]